MENQPTAGAALVTGASGGIGLEIAKILAAEGRPLVLAARSETRLTEIAADLSGRHRIPVHVVTVDLSESGAAKRLHRRAVELGAAPDVLVNNAAFATHGPFAATATDESLAMMRLNMEALVHLTALSLPAMIERGRGRILNVGSTAAFQPGPYMAIYYASKAFVVHYSEALSAELAGTGVTVTAFCPGPVRTGFQKRAGIGYGGALRFVRPMSAEAAARAGVDAMNRGRRLAIPGVFNRMVPLAARVLPRRWSTGILRRVQAGRNRSHETDRRNEP